MDSTRMRRMALAWCGVFAFRFFLLPLRAPNVEPLLAAAMPVGKRAGAFAAAVFAASNIALYDAFTSGIGVWTFVTALSYALVAALAALYFRFAPARRTHFVGFGIVGTILYDALTGLTVGPLVFGQPLALAFYGQIPFTILHLAGTVLFAVVLSPLLDKALAPARETVTVAAVTAA